MFLSEGETFQRSIQMIGMGDDPPDKFRIESLQIFQGLYEVSACRHARTRHPKFFLENGKQGKTSVRIGQTHHYHFTATGNHSFCESGGMGIAHRIEHHIRKGIDRDFQRMEDLVRAERCRNLTTVLQHLHNLDSFE